MHTFRENPARLEFYEEAITIYPEFDDLQSIPLWIDIITFPIDGEVYKYEGTIENVTNEQDHQHKNKSQSGQFKPNLNRSWETEDSYKLKDDSQKKPERKGRTERKRKDKCGKKDDTKNPETYNEISNNRHNNETKKMGKQTLTAPEFVRYTAITLENGTIRLCEVHYKNPQQAQVTRQWFHQFDCPILSCRFFRGK